MTPAPNVKVTPHFTVGEFACKCGCTMTPDIFQKVKQLAPLLEKIRAHFGGKPVHIHSGYRCPRHNKAVGGATRSQHLYGTATDISIPGVTPKQIATFAATLPEIGGIGTYDTFTHVDTRKGRVTWVG